MNNQKLPSLVIVAVLTVVTVVFWVGFDLYRTLQSVPDIKIAAEIMAPLYPVLDSATLNALQQRIHEDENTKNTTRINQLENE